MKKRLKIIPVKNPKPYEIIHKNHLNKYILYS